MTFFTSRVLPFLFAGLALGTAQAQSWNWARGAAASRDPAPARAIALDPTNGQTVVAGSFNDSLRYGNTVLRCEGPMDGYIGRVDAQGQWVSIFRVGGSGFDRIQQVKTAANGDVVVLGSISRNGLPVANQLDSSQIGMFVARYTSGGQLLWANVLEASASDGSTAYSEGLDMDLDPAGNIYVAGLLSVANPSSGAVLQARFDGQLALDSLNSGLFVARLNGSGHWDWAQEVRDRMFSSQTVARLAVAGNQLLLAGNWSRSYGPGSGGPPNAANTFVSAYAATTGQPQWTMPDVTGVAASAEVSALLADGSGRVFVASQGQSLYLTALQAGTGLPLWASAYESGANILETGGLALTPAGDLTLVGNSLLIPGMSCGGPGVGPSGPPYTGFSGALIFNDSTRVSAGSYVARFAGSTGALRWVLNAPCGLYAVADDGLGHTRVAGMYGGGDGVFATAVPNPINFNRWWGGGPLVAELNENGPLLRTISRDTVMVGSDVRLGGDHLAGVTQVTVGGVPVPFQVISDQQIRFTVATTVNGPVAVSAPLGAATNFQVTTLMPLATGADLTTGAMALWPNPAHTAVRLTLPELRPVAVDVMNSLGQVVRRLNASSGSAAVTIPVADLPAGLYTVRAGTRTARLVIE